MSPGNAELLRQAFDAFGTGPDRSTSRSDRARYASKSRGGRARPRLWKPLAVHATVLAENRAALAMLRRTGFAGRSGSGVLHELELAFTEPRRESP